MDSKELVLLQPWLHCNECSRGFDHHNRLEGYGKGQLRISKSDLFFYMTSCGHVYCENCVSQIRQQQSFVCPPCNEQCSLYKLEGILPKRLETYLKQPVGLLEEAVGVMLFQLNNSNELIRGLREKVAQQKELLGKAKIELAQQRKLREQVAVLQNENESLRRQYQSALTSNSIERGNSSSGGVTMSANKSPAISIKLPGRLSLKSPRLAPIPEPSILQSKIYNTPIKYFAFSTLSRSPMTPYSYRTSSNYWQPPPLAPRHHSQHSTRPTM